MVVTATPGSEITGVPAVLIAAFSSRTTGTTGSAGIEARKDELIADYVDRHGGSRRRVSSSGSEQQATLETRPEKVQRSLAELTTTWRRASDARAR